MSEEKNIDQASKSNDNPEDGNENTPQEQAIEQSQDIEEPKTQSENMEVHHHPDLHHRKKHWKEYFLEFLMIFLAVTMGFFAETLREKITEDEKAKQLAENLYQEVYSDSVIVQEKINLRIEREKKLLYFKELVKDSSLTNLSEQFMPSFFWSFVYGSPTVFEPKNGILNQLVNSGTLRFFKNNELQKKIGVLSVAIENVKKRNDAEDNFNEFCSRPFLLKYFDFEWLEKVNEGGKISTEQVADKLQRNVNIPTGKIVNVQNFNRQEAMSLASLQLILVRRTRNGQYEGYKTACYQLLETLRNEYHFENK